LATLEEFKTLRGKLSEEKISSLASTYINDNFKNNKLFLEALKAEGINFDFTSKDDFELDLTEKQQKIYENLYNQHIKDKNKSVNELIRIGSEYSINLTPEDIDIYINELSENDEFDDLELDNEALKIVSGGIAPLAIFLFAVGPGTLMGIGINQARKKDKAKRGGGGW
jgi:hypothetical protein